MGEPTDITRTDEEPHDRLTALTDLMFQAIEPYDKDRKIRGIIFLDEDGRGGSGFFGFEDDLEVVECMLRHATATLKTLKNA